MCEACEVHTGCLSNGCWGVMKVMEAVKARQRESIRKG